MKFLMAVYISVVLDLFSLFLFVEGFWICRRKAFISFRTTTMLRLLGHFPSSAPFKSNISLHLCLWPRSGVNEFYFEF